MSLRGCYSPFISVTLGELNSPAFSSLYIDAQFSCVFEKKLNSGADNQDGFRDVQIRPTHLYCAEYLQYHAYWLLFFQHGSMETWDHSIEESHPAQQGGDHHFLKNHRCPDYFHASSNLHTGHNHFLSYYLWTASTASLGHFDVKLLQVSGDNKPNEEKWLNKYSFFICMVHT